MQKESYVKSYLKDKRWCEYQQTEEFTYLKEFPYYSGLDFSRLDHSLKNEKEYRYLSYHVTPRKLYRHFTDKLTIALPRFPGSTVVPIDIDDHTPDKKICTYDILKKLVSLLGEPFYVEYNYESNGYHSYWNFDEIIPDIALQQLQLFMSQTFGMRIEPVIGNKILRVPFSCDYKFAGKYDPYHFFLVEKINSIKQLTNIFKYKETLTVPTFLKQWMLPSLPVQPEHDTNYSPSNTDKDFSYGYGTRAVNQFRLALSLLHTPSITFEDFVEKCEEWNDGTSKDMKLDEKRRLKIMKNVWEGAQKKFKSSSSFTPSFSSEKKSFSNSIVPTKIIDSLTKVCTYSYLKYSYGKKLFGPTMKRTIEDMIKVYTYLAGIQQHRTINNYHYIEEEMEWAQNGIPFSVSLQKIFAQKQEIPNIKRIISFLKRAGLIKELSNRKGYSYSYKQLRYCKHFVLIDPQSIEKVYQLVNPIEFEKVVQGIKYCKVDYTRLQGTSFSSMKVYKSFQQLVTTYHSFIPSHAEPFLPLSAGRITIDNKNVRNFFEEEGYLTKEGAKTLLLLSGIPLDHRLRKIRNRSSTHLTNKEKAVKRKHKQKNVIIGT